MYNVEYKNSELILFELERLTPDNIDYIQIHDLNIHHCYFEESLPILHLKNFESLDVDQIDFFKIIFEQIKFKSNG